MTTAADQLIPLTRRQFAEYVTGDDGKPLDSIIQQLEQQQAALTGDLPALVAEAQDTADAAGTTANEALNLLNNGAFVMAAADPGLTLARTLTAGLGVTLVDNGAGNSLIVKSDLLSAILSPDVSDVTGAFSPAGILALALLPGATYLIEAQLTFQAAATTTGIGLGFTLPTGANISGGYWHPSAANALQSAYNSAAGVVNANTTTVPAAAVNLPIYGRWIVGGATAAGLAQLQFRTSVPTSAVTLKRDLSIITARRIG